MFTRRVVLLAAAVVTAGCGGQSKQAATHTTKLATKDPVARP